MIIKISREELTETTSVPVPGITPYNFDEMAIPSYLHSNPLVRWLMWKRYQRIAEMCNFRKNLSVLEFGCGSGIFLPTLADQCDEVYAIDLFPQYAKKLASQRGLEINFIEDLSVLPDCSFDIVIAADVLEHFEDPTACLKEIHAKLKASGRLIVSGPTENIAYKIGRVLSGFGEKGDYHHTNINSLIRLIKDNNFKILQQRYLPFRLPPYLFKVVEFQKKEIE